MRIYAGVTDHAWFDYLRGLPACDEVNFWQPSSASRFRALQRGDLFLFKLHRGPRTGHRDLIVGGGVFASFSILPISRAWEDFGVLNGAASYSEMRRQLLQYRKISDADRHEDFQVGCIILTQPFFLDESLWFPAPDWSGPIVRGKGYDMDQAAGRSIWDNVQRAWRMQNVVGLEKEARRIEEEHARFGKETIIRPRLGQGAFRVLVTDAYKRSCAITSEHSLPALEAAHIKPFTEDGPHAVKNGLLLRSDFHRLFDRGYITVTPEYKIEVSGRLKEEFSNGRSYYPFHGRTLNHLPLSANEKPDRELLIWHNENVFRG